MRWINLLAAGAVASYLTGCGIPDSMHVRKGGDPEHVDADVLFRTTFYFRVFDFCEKAGDAVEKPGIALDSLYRYRMTGKGKSAFNKVRFEAGTLRAWEIDPFGATVDFEPDTGKPRFVSQKKHEDERRQKELLEDYDALEKRYLAVSKSVDDDAAIRGVLKEKMLQNLQLLGPGGQVDSLQQARASALKALDELENSVLVGMTSDANRNVVSSALAAQFGPLQKKLSAAINRVDLIVALDVAMSKLTPSNDTDGCTAPAFGNCANIWPSGTATSDDKAELAKLSASAKALVARAKSDLMPSMPGSAGAPTGPQTSLVCSNGLPARRGFQVLGPEGWRTFDQDERLVLAMSSSGDPMLDVLRDLSSRVLNQKAAGLSRADLLEANLAVVRSRAKLEQIDSAAEGESLQKALAEVVSAFEGDKEAR